MSSYIPFVNFSADKQAATSVYNDAAFYRVAIQVPAKTASGFPAGSKLWADAGVDALHHWPMKNNSKYQDYFKDIPGAEQIADMAFQAKPDKKIASAFVKAILDLVLNRISNPEWVSVPQLPYLDGTQRNKVNRILAESAQNWRAKSGHGVKFILPIILTNQRQINKKTERNGKIGNAASCLESSGSTAVWVVDSSLNDQDGTSNFEQTRFPGITNFHEELSAKLGAEIVCVGGPYWGLNLVLWARGLIHFPAIGVGKGFQYYIPGGLLKEGVNRIALPPLRRLAVWSPELRTWIETALARIPKSDAAYSEFSAILRNFQVLGDKEQARLQVARFYKEWFAKLEGVSPQGRALALYQDFSSAYVLGKSLKDLPSKADARSASRIAKQFMGNCL